MRARCGIHCVSDSACLRSASSISRPTIPTKTRARRSSRSDARTNGVLAEDKVSHLGLEIPVDDRESGQVECGMSEHQHPDPSREREDRPEYEPHYRSLLDAGQSLNGIVNQTKPCGGDQHDQCLGAGAGSEKLTESLEHVPAKDSLFSEPRADGHGVQ